MSMTLNKEKNYIRVLIPNSEATISAQIKNIKDSEVTGYYTNDKEEVKKEIVTFLDNDYDYIICVNDVLNMVSKLNEYITDFSSIYKDSMSSINDSYEYFKVNANKYLRIPRMHYSGVENRYLKFENQDPVVKKLRAILYGDITGFDIIKDENDKYYIISPFVKDNAMDILISKKDKLENESNKDIEMSDLRKFYLENLNNNKHIEDEILNQEKFIVEYPIEKIRNLTLDEYCLGLEDFKQSFCYKLEFGDYKTTGFGIGGSVAAKFGIYFSGIDNKYHGKNNKVINDEDVNTYFEEYKKQLVEFLIDMSTNIPEFNVDDKYPMLGGSGNYMVLTKLLALYYPDRFIAISKLDTYKKLCEYLKIKFENDAIKNSYYCNISFRKEVPEANDNHGFYVSDCIWKFFNEQKEETEGEKNKSMKEMFKQWLLENGLKIGTVNGYISTINLTTKDALEDNLIDNDIFEISNVDELDKVIDILSSSEKFLKRKESNHNQNTAALNHYRNFLSDKKNSKIVADKYDKNDFLNEVFIDEKKYDSIVSILNKKKNIILEGAPGVGKTFMAKRLAYSILGTKDTNKVELIQFHQSYSYEDFIEGYRPNEDGFELHRGIFYKLCKKAYNDKSNNYYLIIDEINRGNLSKIFGELLMLIECDKRENSLKLAYSEEEFSVPDNLYIIGLMNTADRSLALIDYALRRRFSFIRIEPAFDSEKFLKSFRDKFDSDYTNIIDTIKKINEAIEDDKSLGSGFKIGHSYFCPNIVDRKGNKKDLEDIIRYEIIPLLEEYWYDDEDTLIQWESTLNGVIND